MKGKRMIILGILGLLALNIPGISAAGEVWGFEEGDTLYYYLTNKEDDTVLAQGSFNVVIDDITNGDVTLTVETSFEGSDAIVYRDNMEVDDEVYLGTSIYMYGLLSFTFLSSVIFYSDVGLEAAATDWNGFFDIVQLFVDLDENMTMTRTLSETGYEINIADSDSDSEYEYYEKREYSTDGNLKSLDYRLITSDGDTTTCKVEKSLLPFPYPNLYVYAAGGAVGLILIVILSCCCKKKK
ncbi:MAG: hypothetical protein ACTSYI_01520 [Promethearchaeota archaeon]